MKSLWNLFQYDFRRRCKDSFLIGYNIIFPIIMIILLGYLSSGSYGREFTGYQYYCVVMLPFCIAMAVITAAYAGKDDAYKKTAVRFLFAPVKVTHIIIAKLFSCTIVISFCNLIVLIFVLLICKLPISAKLPTITLALAAEAFAVCAIGLFIGLGMKNFIFIKNILNIPICIAAVLAGTFFPLGTLNPRWESVIALSPLTWINRGIFLYIYDHDPVILLRSVFVSVSIGIIFAVLAVLLFKKEEFIHGDLPGYEK